MAKKKAVAKRGTTAVTPPIDMSKDSGRGMEGADKDSYSIPFLVVLQGLSPQLNVLEDAKAGMFINSITNELYKKEVKFIPCGFQRKYIQWTPRDEGGGFKGVHDPIAVDSGQVDGVENVNGFLKIDGDDLVDTRMHYIMVYSELTGDWTPAVLSLSKTQVKASKRFMSLIQGIKFKTKQGKLYSPPSFGNIYKATSILEQNDKGQWHGINIVVDSPATDEDLYKACKEFSVEVSAGAVKVSDPSAEATEAF